MLRKLTLRLKTEVVDGLPRLLPAELLLDDRPLPGVQKVALALDAGDMVPAVVLTMIPHQLDVEVDAPADVARVLGKARAGFAYDLAGSDPVPPPGAADRAPTAFEQFDKLFAGSAGGRAAAAVAADGTFRPVPAAEFDRVAMGGRPAPPPPG